MELFGISNLWLFLITSVILITSPGIDTMLVLNRSVANGRGIGLSCTLGIVTGLLVHTLFGVLGVSIILSEAAFLFSALKIIGAIYLFYLGFVKLFSRNKNTGANRKQNAITHKKSFTSGFVTNVFNPKVALFFLAFFPQFIDPNSGYSIGVNFLVMGVIFMLLTLVWLTLITLLISHFSNLLLKGNKAKIVIEKISGLVFIGMGLKLALTTKD